MGCWDCFYGILYYYPLMMCMRFTVLGVVLGGLLLGAGCNNGNGVVESVERAFLWEEEKDIEEWGNPVVNVTYKARPKSLEENLKKARVHVTFKRQGSGE